MTTQRERMLRGDPYDTRDAELLAMAHRARALTARYAAIPSTDGAGRHAVLSELLGSVGDEVWIEPPFFCDYGEHIRLGARVFMNFQCIILDCNLVTLGDDVFLGPGVHIYAATHPLDADERIKGPELGRPVTIGAKVWIGGGSIICPGVTIGEGSTLGAGSVVVKDIPPYVFAAGNPCRVIREIEE